MINKNIVHKGNQISVYGIVLLEPNVLNIIEDHEKRNLVDISDDKEANDLRNL